MTPSKLIKTFIACEQSDVPLAEEIVSILALMGHQIALLDIRYGFFGSICLDMAVGSNKSRVYVDISADFKEDTKTIEQMYVQKYYQQDTSNIRRLVCIRGWEHASSIFMSDLVAFFCTQGKGNVFRSIIE